MSFVTALIDLKPDLKLHSEVVTKMRKIFFRICAAILSLCIFTGVCVYAEGENVSDYVEYDFDGIFDCILEKQPTCTAEKTEFDGRRAVKVTPTPETKSAAVTALDSWSLARDEKRADLSKFRFI